MLLAMTDYKQDLEYPYITPGKFYIATKSATGGVYFILDDVGESIPIAKGRPSAHLDDVGSFKFFMATELS